MKVRRNYKVGDYVKLSTEHGNGIKPGDVAIIKEIAFTPLTSYRLECKNVRFWVRENEISPIRFNIGDKARLSVNVHYFDLQAGDIVEIACYDANKQYCYGIVKFAENHLPIMVCENDLEEYEDGIEKEPVKTYEDGLQEAWKLAKTLFSIDCNTLVAMFKENDALDVLHNHSVDNVLKIMSEWNGSHSFAIGDIVAIDSTNEQGLVVEVDKFEERIAVLLKDNSICNFDFIQCRKINKLNLKDLLTTEN